VCRPKHVEQLRNIGKINSTTRLHLVGSFCEMYKRESQLKAVTNTLDLINGGKYFK
jgi:hypothetical protein